MLKAVIREIDCVGCGKCLPACPVDAIIGAPKWMHTVLEQDCIGCKLCVAPCPMDCIEMVESEKIQGGHDPELQKLAYEQKKDLANRAKKRYQVKKQRTEKLKALELLHLPTDSDSKLRIQSEIQASLQRVRKKMELQSL